MVNVRDISDYINSFAPYNTKCDWDNCGILVGDGDKQVNKIAFALDLTKETLGEAKKFGAELIITHHPVIFRAQNNFLKGNLPYELAVSGISAISAHTCFDCAFGGVNDVLCEILGITDAEGVPSSDCAVPMARIGSVEEISSSDFSAFVAEKLSTVCRVADASNTIRRVAVCGGAGMDFFSEAVKMGADAYVTGDVSHHGFLEAKEKGVTVIAAGHFETECLVINQTNPVKFIG